VTPSDHLWAAAAAGEARQVDVPTLLAPYSGYSLSWLIRLRRGEVDRATPARVSTARLVAQEHTT
jgi:hypothetical protein